MKKQTVALVLAVALVIGCSMGGTMAWLTSQSNKVTNVFTTSDINITLEETQGGEGKEFKMIPGWTIAKDPMVTVKAGSEDCFVFVEIEKSNNYEDYLDAYVVNDGWEQLKNGDTKMEGVFYQKVTGLTESNAQAWTDYVLAAGHKTDCSKDEDCVCENAHGYVTVKETVTKEMMNALTKETYPTLTFTAYATQLCKDNDTEFSAAEAWEKVKPQEEQETPAN